MDDVGTRCAGGISLPHTVTLMTTDRCTASCRTCGVGAGPTGSQRLSLHDMRRYVDEAAELGVRLVVFSGGEPFFLGQELDAAVRHAASAGLLTRVVSNAYWAVSQEAALGRLAELREAGLSEVNYSTGDNHQQFVPVQNVVNGIRAAARLGMSCAVMVELHEGSSYTGDSLKAERELSEVVGDPKGRFHIIESPWVDVNTDASQRPGGGHLLTKQTLKHRTGCAGIIGTIAVDSGETMGACCGITRNRIPELTIGSLRRNSMAELVAAMKSDFMKRWLFTQGPEHILAWAAELDTAIEWEARYAHQCHACYAVYRDPAVRAVVARRYERKLLDVSLQYWMMTRPDAHGRGTSKTAQEEQGEESRNDNPEQHLELEAV